MRRKMILALMLAIASSVWMMSGATCLTQAPNELYWSYITVSGTIQWLDSPCEEGEECPPCVTPAIVTSDKTYYLSSSNQEVRDFLDRIEVAPIPAIYLLPLQARASGTPYTKGSFDFLVVNDIDDLYVEYFSDQLTRLNSLCDEWNVWHESFESYGPVNFDKVVKYQLTTDTIINGQRYVKLTSDKDSPYLGAMREGNNRDIYYVPEGSTNEFLLYAFNAQVGEVLNDLYLGGFEENGYSGRVEAISDGSPRLFTIRVLYPDGMGVEPGESFSVTWIEGVGSPETPYGLAVVPTVPADIGVYTLLCAYKNGEHIYTSDLGEQYGCEYSTQDEKKKIIGTWQVYKETLSGNDYNEHGEIEYLSRTRDVNDSPTYNFDDSTLLIVCPTCYYTPKHYVLTPKGPTTWNLWVENMFTIQQKPSDPAEGGFSTITIHQLTGNLMEWEYIAYGGDEGPITCYQYLRRVGTQDSDTIPLYAQDDSGSSTVDPVDPNQVIATLKGDELTIRDNSGEEIMMALSMSEGDASVPAFNRVQRTQSFRNELTVTLTEEGLYRLELSNPSWEYTIYGTFRYPQQHDAIDQTLAVPAAQKILRNGQLLIRIGDKVYTVHGTEVGE